MPIDSNIYNNQKGTVDLVGSLSKGYSLGQQIKQSKKIDEADSKKRAISDLYRNAIENGTSVDSKQIAQYDPALAFKINQEQGSQKVASDGRIQKQKNSDRAYSLQKQEFNERREARLAKDSGKTKLSANDVLKVNEGNLIPQMLSELEKTIGDNSDMIGPVGGRLASYNPYNDRMKTFEADIRSKAQAFGKYMEGGVLRKEDEVKYEKMFPNGSDTPVVAKSKLAIVRKLLIDKQNSNISALKDSGYDVSALNKNFVSPKKPDILVRNKESVNLSPLGISDAQASDIVQSTKQFLQTSDRATKEAKLAELLQQ